MEVAADLRTDIESDPDPDPDPDPVEAVLPVAVDGFVAVAVGLVDVVDVVDEDGVVEVVPAGLESALTGAPATTILNHVE